MKRFLLLLGLSAFFTASWAQRPYFCITEGTVLEYENYGLTGNVDGYVRMHIQNVQGADGNYSVSYVITPYSPDRTPSFDPMEMKVAIANGNISATFGSIALMEVSGDVPFIPSRLAVGLDLGGGLMKISALGLNFNSEVLSHKVVGREELSTPAGTFKCYIVEMTSETRVLMQKSVTTRRNWYARGVGVVKSETMDNKGDITNSQLLIKLED